MMINAHKKIKNQQGVILISAIFILIVIASIVAFGLKIATSQKASVNYSLQGIKAYYAAKAGLAYAKSYIEQHHTCPKITEANLKGNLTDFKFELSCKTKPWQESGVQKHYFSLSSTGVYHLTQSSFLDISNPFFAKRVIKYQFVI